MNGRTQVLNIWLLKYSLIGGEKYYAKVHIRRYLSIWITPAWVVKTYTVSARVNVGVAGNMGFFVGRSSWQETSFCEVKWHISNKIILLFLFSLGLVISLWSKSSKIRQKVKPWHQLYPTLTNSTSIVPHIPQSPT